MKNPNYQQTDEGFIRREDAPDAKHKSRIDWSRAVSIGNVRRGVSELRKKQDEINEEYRKRHNG